MRSSKNNSNQYTKTQLRELVVSYYALVDPNGLSTGVDINGIVEWCAFYGLFLLYLSRLFIYFIFILLSNTV